VEELPEEREEITRAQKLKIAAGAGVLAAGASVEIWGAAVDKTYTMLGGAMVAAAGAYYALNHLPEGSKQFLNENFHVPFFKSK
jgi:hypothetical protein